MANQALTSGALVRTSSFAKNAALVVGASVAISICARLNVYFPFSPVPFTLANFALLAAGILLGSRRAGMAAMLYLGYGAAGIPVFSTGAGIGQLLGVTAGYLWAYPVMAFVAGFIAERGKASFVRNAVAAVAAEIVLFGSGIAWLRVYTNSWEQAAIAGGYWFLFFEMMKVAAVAGIGTRFRRIS